MTANPASSWPRLLILLFAAALPLTVGSTDSDSLASGSSPAEADQPIDAPHGLEKPLSAFERWQQLQRERMSPTDLPGATGSARHPSLYGPKRNDPALGIPRHAYSPFDQATSMPSHCPSGGCDYDPETVLIKLQPEVSVAKPAVAGQAMSVMALSAPGLSQALFDRGLTEMEPLFPGAARPQAGAMAMRPDGVTVPMPDLTRWVRVRSTAGAAALDVEATIEALNDEPGVDYAEPDYLREPVGGPEGAADPRNTPIAPADAQITALFDSDPRVGEQWHLDAANVPAAWQELADQGLPAGGSSDVVIAVIDTGVDYQHEDLAANMWVNSAEFNGTPGVDDDGNGYIDDIHGAVVVSGDLSGDPQDDHGHGTHVAGIIAAQADNGVGGTGVAPNTRIMAIKAAQYSGVLAASDIARGIYYAVEKGADVINMSFGGYARSTAEEDALAVAFGSAVLVAAAGNDSRVNLPCPLGANLYPAAYNWVLGVMAHDEANSLASFSNYDCTQQDAQEYELQAPGVQILSTLPADGYGAWSGTSMATPVVAGIAALARTQWPDKASYSSRFIMGQIASTANYGPSDALATLTEVPQPSLSYLEHYLFDTPEVDAGNDDDGIVDAGETVDLAVIIRNHWGKADNVQVTLEAQAEGAVQPDPYVTMLTDTVDYGAVGSFNNDDNGLIKDAEGAIIGVEHPFRFQVAADTPNDHLIPFLLTMTADNGYDPGAGSLTTYSRFYLLVQRGRELPRIISQDMTLTKDDYWLVSDATLIEEGVTVNVTEGTQIQFFSGDPEDPYAGQVRPRLQVEGSLIIQGTVEEPAEVFTGLLYPARPIQIQQVGTGEIQFSHILMSNPVVGYSKDFYTDNNVAGASPLASVDHAVFSQQVECLDIYKTYRSPPEWGYCNSGPQRPRIVADGLLASVVSGLGCCFPNRSLHLSAPIVSTLVDNCYLEKDSGSASTEVFTRTDSFENVFLLNSRLSGYPNSSARSRVGSILRPAFFPIAGELQRFFYDNVILNDWADPDISRWLRFSMEGDRETISYLADNYWGTTSTTLIEKAIHDYNDDFNLGIIEYEPILTEPPETAYPFVADVTVATTEGPATEVGAEPITFTVTFNRDMDMAVPPQVSFGPAEPYTDYSVAGDWTDPRTWEGDFTVTPITGDGEQSIRVAGAVAADDAWLVTGNDFGRFRFEIITSGTEGMNLQATGGEGYVDLWWTQNDFDTLAGYNLYRSTSPDSGFARINETVIPYGLTTWHDTDVQPGVPYYYFFTVVETGLGDESDPSNTATATPTDTIPPVLSHTPISEAAPGQPLSLTADATDNVAVQSVTLYHRAMGASDYSSRPMIHTTGDRYAATLEGSLLAAPGIEYYIEASDGISLARSGRADLPWQVTIEDKPTVTSVTPASGPADGGTNVTVTGTNFKDSATVTFGGAACGSVVRVSSTQITCTTPAHFPEQVDVTVTNPDDQSGTLLRGFVYMSETASLGLPDLSAGQGTLVQVPVNAANIQGLLSAAFTLTFDPAVLSIQDVTTGSLTPGWTLATNTDVAGQVTVTMSSAGTVTGAGVLANLEFAAIGAPDSTSALALGSVLLNDGGISATTADGSVTVESVYDISGTVSYWSGGQPVSGIDLDLSGARLYSGTTDGAGDYVVAGAPAGDYSLTPSGASAEGGVSALDASLALRHQAGLEALSGTALAAADVNQNGAVTSHDASYMLQRAVGLIDLPFPGAGTVWIFDPVERTYTDLSADQTGQDFTAILLGDPTGNWAGAPDPASVAAPASSGTGAALALPHLAVSGEGQIELPVSLTLPQGDIQAVDLEIHYDPTVVEVLGAQIGDLGADWQLAVNLTTPGVVRASLAGSSPITAAAAVALLRLQVQATGDDDTSTSVQLLRGDLDEGGIAADRVHGAAMLAETFTGDHLELGGLIETTASYVAQSTITAGPTLTVGSAADVAMQAGEAIVFAPGFRMRAGATLRARVTPTP